MTLTVAPRIPTRHVILLDDKRWRHQWLVMYSTQTMVHVQIYMYISRPKYTRQSPDCPLVIFSHIALPLAHCSTSYSSASLAQYCIVAPHSLLVDSACLHYHRQHRSRVSPSDHTSLSVVQPLPAISSESQQSHLSSHLHTPHPVSSWVQLYFLLQGGQCQSRKKSHFHHLWG